MSHFTVMVIGDDPEKQLSPFDESLESPLRCTGEVSDEEKNDMIEYYKDPQRGGIDLPFDELYKLKGEDWNGGQFKKDAGVWKSYTSYNENSKWDWYQMGGRWSGFLKLKEGAKGENGERSWANKNEPAKAGWADAALKKDIDFEGMKNEAAEIAGKEWDKANEVLKDLPVSESWESIRRRYTKNDTDFTDIDKARSEYNSQPRVVACYQRLDFGYPPENFAISREEYIQNARNGAISTFAMLKYGEWIEKGEMGWFGMARNEKNQNEWDKYFSDTIDSLPDDTMISIYDCHI